MTSPMFTEATCSIVKSQDPSLSLSLTKDGGGGRRRVQLLDSKTSSLVHSPFIPSSRLDPQLHLYTSLPLHHPLLHTLRFLPESRGGQRQCQISSQESALNSGTWQQLDGEKAGMGASGCCLYGHGIGGCDGCCCCGWCWVGADVG